MPYEKIKSEKYTNVGGINEKSSNYATGENEVLKLQNLDFQEPGAYTCRWGFTYGLTGNTLTPEEISAVFQTSIPALGSVMNLVAGITSMYRYTISLASSVGRYAGIGVAGMGNSGAMSFASYNIMTVSAGRNGIYKIGDPAAGYPTAWFGLPTIWNPTNNVIAATGTGSIPAGTYNYRFGLYDSFGGVEFLKYYGPVILSVDGLTLPPMAIAPTLSVYAIQIGMTNAFEGQASSYAPTGFAIYRDNVPGFPANQYVFRGIAAPGATFSDLPDYDTAWQTVAPREPKLVTELSGVQTPRYILGRPLASVSKGMNLFCMFNGFLFAGCFRDYDFNGTYLLFSEKDDPQSLNYSNLIPLSETDAGLSGMKVYNQSLIITTYRGIFRLTGDSKDSFNIQCISQEYGCLSNASIVEFNHLLWFLDEQNIVEFNGSSFQIVSTKINDTMKSINYTAAKQHACALHVPERNEVWFAVPVGASATKNNTILVYDYLVKAWTTFTNINTNFLARIFTNNGTSVPRSFFGLTAPLYFDPTLTVDYNSGITCLIKGKFHDEIDGNRGSKIFRRLFIDGPNNGVTLSVNINMYLNHATTTIGYTTSMVVGSTFQSRIDFGVPAKSLSVEFVHVSTTSKFKLYGYILESRFLRKT